MADGVPLIYSGQEEPVLRALKFFDRDPIRWGNFQQATFYKVDCLRYTKRNSALSADASFRKVPAGNGRPVYAYVREKGRDRVLVILNLSDREQSITISDSKV